MTVPMRPDPVSPLVQALMRALGSGQQRPRSPAVTLDSLTHSPFVDSLTQIAGRPSYRVMPDHGEPSQLRPGQTVYQSGQYDRDFDTRQAIISMTPKALQNVDRTDDPMQSGYERIPGQPFGDWVMAHEYGHHVESLAKSRNFFPDSSAMSPAFAQAMLTVAKKPDAETGDSRMDPETFAERFNAAVQFLRGGRTDLSTIHPEAQEIAAALLKQPIYANHALNRLTTAKPDATAIQATPNGSSDFGRTLMAALQK